MACLDTLTFIRQTTKMVTIDLLDNRLVELTDELKRVEGSIRENRQMRDWLASLPKEEPMACKGGTKKGGKGK
jgi:hypothetical protein